MLEADIAMLESVEGVGHSAALYLRLIGEVARRKDLRQVKRGQKMDTFKQIVDFMQPLFGGLTVERDSRALRLRPRDKLRYAG